jgi:tRNA A-37 threonylcarbamoyl transferase component Bud32
MTQLARQIGPYRVIAEPAAGRSVLVEDFRGRRLVIKAVESDCLLRGQLHPSIRERLTRVRELAQKNVAALLGVEKHQEQVYLVWAHVAGEPIQAYASRAGADQLLTLVRELLLAVETLHARGIVHGALHSGNIIVDRHGRIHLIDISPLLYDDPAADEAAIARLIEQLLTDRPDDPRLSRLLEVVRGPSRGLTALRMRVSALLATGLDPEQLPGRRARDKLRRRTLLAALLAALVGVAISWAILQNVSP